MTICYLDPEDEITGAVARLRAVGDGEAVLVLPPGSRIATSRINFRLLAREAEQNRLSLVAVSDEPGVRALAISAGLPAYDSIAAAQAGLAEFRRQDQRLAERVRGGSAKPGHGGDDQAPRSTPPAPGPAAATPAAPPRELLAPAPEVRPADRGAADGGVSGDTQPLVAVGPRTGQPADATRVLTIPAIEAERRSLPARGEERVEVVAADDVLEGSHPPRRWRRRWAYTPLVTVLLLLALVGVAAYGAYTLVPTASVTIRPHLTAVGPVSSDVVADVRVAVVDPGEGVIPAQQLQVPLSVSGEFTATGSRVTTTRASGSVRFTSQNTLSEVPIPAGTLVATAGGLEFETTADRVVPRAVFATGTEGEVDAPVRAVRAGPRGNVAAGAITVLPNVIAEQLVRVTNPQPTSGGERRQTTVVSADDYQAARAELIDLLDAQLVDVLADPETTPRGLIVYPASAEIGEATSDQPQSELVNRATEAFSLTVTATATVLAVNEAQVDEVIVEQLRALVPPDSTLVDDSVEATHTPGEVAGNLIVFSASANGRAYRVPDRDTLVAEIRGLPVSEAREIIGRYGTSELTVWPDFVDRVPDQPARINLTILPPTEAT